MSEGKELQILVRLPYSVAHPDNVPDTPVVNVIEVYQANNEKAYFITGKREPCVIIRCEGHLAAMLFPHHIEAILEFWNRD